MIAILTGDIINSRKDKQGIWRDKLKNILSIYGKEPENWEIFRGDSFQLEISLLESLKAALSIKASIKQIKDIDVRIAIGIGEKDYESNRITQSTGAAFINSGVCFDNLKKYSLLIKSPNSEFDEEMNLYLILALLVMDNWLPVTAQVVKESILHQEMNQIVLAKMLGKSQSTISEALKRAGYDEIMKMEKRYRKLVNQYFMVDKLNEK